MEEGQKTRVRGSWCLRVYSRGTGYFYRVLTRRLILSALGKDIIDEYKERSLGGLAACLNPASQQRVN